MCLLLFAPVGALVSGNPLALGFPWALDHLQLPADPGRAAQVPQVKHLTH